MDDDFYSASRQIAEYTKNRPKKYRNSGWKYYNGYYRGARYGRLLPETGWVYYDTQAWGALRKCWRAFKIANSKGDVKNMVYYAKGIMKFQMELGLEVRSFPDLGLYEKENSNGAREATMNELEFSSGRNDDESYESETQPAWRKRMKTYY